MKNIAKSILGSLNTRRKSNIAKSIVGSLLLEEATLLNLLLGLNIKRKSSMLGSLILEVKAALLNIFLGL